MESRPATMIKASRGGATPLCSALPEDIVLWEILVRLPPKSLLRCRSVCRAWHGATSTRPFQLAHHSRQPCLPVVYALDRVRRYDDILAFDHLAAGAQLQPVARLNDSFRMEASCDGILILYNHPHNYSVCNPATHMHVPLRHLSGFNLLELYPHHSTGEYRLLLRRVIADQIGCYVYALGSDQPPRYIGALQAALSGPYLQKPALVRHRLHWSTMYHHSVVFVFDTISESFWQMCAPVVPAKPYTFEMGNTLGIYTYTDDDANAMQTVDIWVLRNYENEVWEHKYIVRLPASEISGLIGCLDENWDVNVEFANGEVLLLVNHGGWMFYVDTDGKLVGSFHRDGQRVYACNLRLKQTLVQHTFFTALEAGYEVDASTPFVSTA